MLLALLLSTSYAAPMGRFLDVAAAVDDEGTCEYTGVLRYVCSSGKDGKKSGMCEQPSGRVSSSEDDDEEEDEGIDGGGSAVDEVGFAGWQNKTRL